LKNLKLPKYLPIFLILFFALFIRLWRLWIPENFYFDEVYHAFTAREMLAGNPAAWEFWNTPPDGFAYEWTHPPLAKLFMAFGMLIFGINPFGWRFFGALFGVGIIFLTYLLGKKLFKSEPVGLFGALLLSFEGLTFVQTRIGMNDAYFLFFMLLSLWFLLSKRYFLSGLFWGASLASKWTALYTIFIFGFYFIYQFVQMDKKERLKFIGRMVFTIPICFIVVPIFIYFLSYLPFFFLEHPMIAQQVDKKSAIVKIEQTVCPTLGFSQKICDNLAVLWSIQQQMYWYHTRLSATHPFQSAWYSWPFDARPVWYYVRSEDSKVANIYNLGNPVILWFGILALFHTLWQAVKTRSFALIFVLLSYVAFWLPWAMSPRIMFFYHYLPSIPFLTLAISYLLLSGWQNKLGRVLIVGFLVLSGLIFFYFYPHWSALPVPKWLSDSYFWFPSWR